MKHIFVTTTINIPRNLEDYAKDAAEHGMKDVSFIIAGDRKTPAEAAACCQDIEKRFGFQTLYMDVEEQNAFLEHFEEYNRFLPWNCIQRRNVAILKAYANGADFIYTIDDDNYLHTKNYIAAHALTQKPVTVKTVSSSSQWYNICSVLKERSARKFFHRGYSQQQRAYPEPQLTTVNMTGRVVVNAGLWLGDPDVDAVTRLAIAPEVTGIEMDGPIALAHGTRGPFNSQNTALLRDIVPTYCMHVGVGRFDDIIPSYFVKRIADHLGDYIRFGEPLVRQDRNEHDLWVDADKERLGCQLIDRIVEFLYAIELKGKDYESCLREILPHFKASTDVAEKLTADQRSYLNMIHTNYVAWLSAIECLPA